MEQKFCQSCGMPLNPEVLGTKKKVNDLKKKQDVKNKF